VRQPGIRQMFRRVPISESRTPTFALVITLKTAKALGLTIPSAVHVVTANRPTFPIMDTRTGTLASTRSKHISGTLTRPLIQP